MVRVAIVDSGINFDHPHLAGTSATGVSLAGGGFDDGAGHGTCVAALVHSQITVPGYAMPLQLWVQAARAGLRVAELPVRLIYDDPNRHFGGILDDPTARLNHYLDVLEMELHAAGYPGLDPGLCTTQDAPHAWGCPG
jgi:hypothetical protein